MKKKLDSITTFNAVKHTYDERNNMIIIGLTGRTGSGCTTLSKILSSKNYEQLDLPEFHSHNYRCIEDRKDYIVDRFLRRDGKWESFTVIDVSSLILQFVFEQGKEALQQFLANIANNNDAGTLMISGKDNICDAIDCFDDIFQLAQKFSLANGIENIDYDADEYYEYFLKTVIIQKRRFRSFLEDYHCYYDSFTSEKGHKRKQYNLYTYLMQMFANNLRASGNPFNQEFVSNKYTIIAERIRDIITIIKKHNGNKSCRICIDAIRNSYEAFYLRDKYKAFYLVSVSSEEESRQKRLAHLNRYEIENLDIIEFSGKLDRPEMVFYHQNVQTCMEIADIHVYNDEVKNGKYCSLTKQIVKYISLMLHPGLITPSAIERCMQFAYNAKLNSGCLSRQVGAVVTRDDYTVQAIGWNDVPKGQVSCLYRDVHDYCINKDCNMHSKFELENKEFARSLSAIDAALEKSKKELHCDYMCTPYCFKDVYNGIKREKNQVHTRALHAEENAFLQISKYGGVSINGGYLFTTASPCELCSKKAYQLGIKKIYYIDIYPGISRSHVLTFGGNNNPEMIMFQGAIGEAYVSLYRPRIAFKDETELITGINIKDLAKCEPEEDGLEYGDIKYEKSCLELKFNGNRTDVVINRYSEVKLLKEKIEYFIRNFEWTESTFESIELDVKESDSDVTLQELPNEYPKSYKISFGNRSVSEESANNVVKYGVLIKAKDEKKMMERIVAQYVMFQTDVLELRLITPDNVIKNVRKKIYGDLDKKILVSDQEMAAEDVTSNEEGGKVYSFIVKNASVHHLYAIEWDFI